MKIGKKQIVFASLVLALGAAVYLNWQFSDTNLVQTGAEQTIGEAQLVSNQSDESTKEDSNNSKPSLNQRTANLTFNCKNRQAAFSG